MSRFQLDARAKLGAVTLERHRHDNGLAVIVCRDPSTPLCAVQTWYRVGSANETRGQTGIAHLFEHLMFHPTREVAAGEFDRLIEERGGDCNAATWVDWTSYSITLPSADFDLALRLEADRMVNLVLDDDVLESEREVVVNERLERVEDDIGGFLDEELARAAFTTHPYGWPTIGFMDDIRALDLATIERFYATYYAPNNATVVVAGPEDVAAVLAAVDAHFGDLAPAPIERRALASEPAQTTERRLRFEKPTATSRLLLGYHVPGQGHADWPALAALSSLLCGGPSARLHQHLVADRELAIYADCEALPFRDPTLLRLAIGGALDVADDALLDATDEIVSALARGEAAVTPDELEKVKAGLETDFWIELETADGKAEALGHFETTLGDFRALLETADRLKRVTADDIERVARTYLRPERRTVVAGVPG